MQTTTLIDTIIADNIRFNEPAFDVAQIMGGLYGDGIIGFKNAFNREWVQQLHEDIMGAYEML